MRTGALEMKLTMLVLAYGAGKIRVLLLDERPGFGNKVCRDRALKLEGQANVHCAAYLLPKPERPRLALGARCHLLKTKEVQVTYSSSLRSLIDCAEQ